MQTGQKFNKLTAVKFKTFKGRHPYRQFKCDCGGEKTICIYNVIKGKTKSCGCIIGKGSVTHGMSKTRFYDIWAGINKRCYNTNATNYYLYGARGIKTDEKRKQFKHFRDDMYISYLKHTKDFGIIETTIDRIDVNGDYNKNNCKRSTLSEQAKSKRTSLLFELDGIVRSLKERCEEYKISYKRVYYRIKRFGWDFEKALKTPIKIKYRNKSLSS